MTVPDLPVKKCARLLLDPQRFDAPILLIEIPPATGPKLQALLRRVPVWDR